MNLFLAIGLAVLGVAVIVGLICGYAWIAGLRDSAGDRCDQFPLPPVKPLNEALWSVVITGHDMPQVRRAAASSEIADAFVARFGSDEMHLPEQDRRTATKRPWAGSLIDHTAAIHRPEGIKTAEDATRRWCAYDSRTGEFHPGAHYRDAEELVIYLNLSNTVHYGGTDRIAWLVRSPFLLDMHDQAVARRDAQIAALLSATEPLEVA